jgi:hypothetical protein
LESRFCRMESCGGNYINPGMAIPFCSEGDILLFRDD